METVIVKNNSAIITDMKVRMSDILVSVSWKEIANTYFGKSSSWLYHKMDGIDGNGGQGGFNEAESQTMREALYDLSARIKNAADRI